MEFSFESNRIFATDDSGKVIAEITFPETEEGTVDINRTFVDPSLRGQGIAGQLVKMAFEQITSSNKKAILSCPYAVKWAAENRPPE
ncbi:MAG: N-acetyltransferase [Oscillospiraceae bacterium]|nr:N-acetyltransferase [Oscillospiraceae bacterium]